MKNQQLTNLFASLSKDELHHLIRAMSILEEILDLQRDRQPYPDILPK